VTGRGLIVAGFVIASAMLLSAASEADDQDVIDYREHIMKTMGEQVAAIGQMAQQKIPQDNFATHVQILAVTAATAKMAFAPKVPGGKAKPDVWANWGDFAKRLDALTAATADLANAVWGGGVTVTSPKVQAAFTCKSCHDLYREEKK
jgi:cytochrome c556